jgi:hypothetical protein
MQLTSDDFIYLGIIVECFLFGEIDICSTTVTSLILKIHFRSLFWRICFASAMSCIQKRGP